jgi:predicted HTH transcriptional regulator
LEKTVCAFSNQRGGTLFIGVCDDGDIEGLAGDLARRGEAVDADDVRKRLRETLKDNQCFSLGVAKVADTQLVIVTVATSPDVNFLVKTRTAYIRHGGSSMKLTAQELKAMIQSSGRSPFG